MANIVLIENQLSQFEKIISCFGNTEHNIYPEVSEYVDFTDKIRVGLSKRYGNFLHPDSRRRLVIQQVVNFINIKNAELLIIDHKLVGYHDGQNGIDLANYFRKDFGLIQPIIFLSRTEKSDQSVKDKINDIPNCVWVEKGYASQQILDETYFQKYVISEISNLIKESDFVRYIKKLEWISSLRILDESRHFFSSKIEIIKDSGSFSETQRHAIDNFMNSEYRNSETIDALIKSL